MPLILAGYFPRRIMSAPVELNAPQVREIWSASSHISRGPPDGWIDRWVHNSQWLFDTAELALSVLSAAESYPVVAYRVWSQEFVDGQTQDIAFPELAIASFQGFTSLGFDVVSSSSGGRSFECSPLSVDPKMRRHRRPGLRIHGHRGHPEVAAALVRYARWLRLQFAFPLRVPVYLIPGMTVRTMHGEDGTAAIFLPWKRNVEPYIRIATGDYPALRRAHGRDNALAAFLGSLSHEVVHYRQWIETGRSWERGVAVRASRLVERYAQTTDHP